MKKLILLIIVFAILLVTALIIFKVNKKKSIINSQDNKMLETEIGNIISVKMREATEGGYLYYKAEDREMIAKIYNALKNVKIGKKADINIVDDCRDYIFDLDDGTEKVFSFQSSFYYKDYNTYETENYKELKQIEMPKTESWDK